MSNKKYAKNIIDRPKEGFGPPETPEEAKRREEHVKFPLYVDEEVVPGAYYFMAAWWKKITGKGSPAEEHDHAFDEYLVFLGTNPEDPDTDNDGWTDGAEVAIGTNPLNPGDFPRQIFIPLVR